MSNRREICLPGFESQNRRDYGTPGETIPHPDYVAYEKNQKRLARLERMAATRAARKEAERRIEEWRTGQFWWKMRVRSLVKTSAEGRFTVKHGGKIPLILKPFAWLGLVVPWMVVGLAIELFIPEIYWRNSSKAIPLVKPAEQPRRRGARK